MAVDVDMDPVKLNARVKGLLELLDTENGDLTALEQAAVLRNAANAVEEADQARFAAETRRAYINRINKGGFGR